LAPDKVEKTVLVVLLIMLLQLLINWAPLPLNRSGLIVNTYFYTVTGSVLLLAAVGLSLGARHTGKPDMLYGKRFSILLCTMIVIGSLIFGLDAYLASFTLRTGGGGERVTEEISLVVYAPFSENNQLVKIGDTVPIISKAIQKLESIK